MMWPFRKKTVANQLVFKNSEAFFKYQCKYGNTLVDVGELIYGLVLGISPISKGSQLCWVRLASPDGGFHAVTAVDSGKNPLEVGDAIAWQTYALSAEAPNEVAFSNAFSLFTNDGFKVSDQSFVVGKILARVSPLIDLDMGVPIEQEYH